jgi:ABC-2 type transport system ATP-binding protein
MSDGGATVVADGLRKTFEAPGGGPLHAVGGLSLTVRAGELTALVGPDGAGKTTLMRMMAGLLKPDAGDIAVLGIDVAPTIRRRCRTASATCRSASACTKT